MSDSGSNQTLIVVLGVLALLILMPLIAALLRAAADAAASAVPGLIVLWFIISILAAMVSRLKL